MIYTGRDNHQYLQCSLIFKMFHRVMPFGPHTPCRRGQVFLSPSADEENEGTEGTWQATGLVGQDGATTGGGGLGSEDSFILFPRLLDRGPVSDKCFSFCSSVSVPTLPLSLSFLLHHHLKLWEKVHTTYWEFNQKWALIPSGIMAVWGQR